MTTFPKMQKRRVIVLLAGLGAWTVAVEARLAQLQVVRHHEFVERAERQQQRTIALNPKRGVIYDARGRELAVSVEVDSLYAVPSAIADRAAAAAALSAVLGVDRAGLERRLASDKDFVWIKRKLDPATLEKVMALGLRGVQSLEESKRFYPKAQRAASVLGYVGLDNQGLAGLEHAWERTIAGKPGAMTVLNDARQDRLVPEGAYRRAPTAGRSLKLTLDESLQYIAEKELAAGVRAAQALAGSLLMMDPQSGAILAMASYPTFDPNAYTRVSSSAWRNRAVADAYEPGSTFKCLSGVAALEEELVRPSDLIDCEAGAYDLGAAVVHDHEAYGILSFEDVIAHSSNIGAIKVGLRLGPERLDRYLRAFGFGVPTGIELPGENPGLLRPLSRWSKLSNAMLSMGQEVNVTPIQLAAAISTIANGGSYWRPYVVAEVLDPDGVAIERFAPRLERRVISEASAATMRAMMARVITDGTGRGIELAGYEVAGKTGTAQKAGRGGYRAGAYVASFAGFVPVEQPRLVVLVVIDEPRGHYYGAQVAAPVFEAVLAPAVRYLRIPPTTAPRHDLIAAHFSPPGDAVGARFIAPSNAPPNMGAMNRAPTHSASDGGSTVPDLRGHSLRAGVAALTRLGASVRLQGRGAIAASDPAPGSEFPDDGVVTLTLADFAGAGGR